MISWIDWCSSVLTCHAPPKTASALPATAIVSTRIKLNVLRRKHLSARGLSDAFTLIWTIEADDVAWLSCRAEAMLHRVGRGPTKHDAIPSGHRRYRMRARGRAIGLFAALSVGPCTGRTAGSGILQSGRLVGRKDGKCPITRGHFNMVGPASGILER